MPVSTTLSSVGTGRAVNIDWQAAKFTTYAVTGSSSGSFTYTIEATPDDVQQTPAASVAWFALSSATTSNSSLSIFTGPIGAIRLNASAISSAILTLKVLQGIGG